MGKFKVGDRVRVVEKGCLAVEVGREGTVLFSLASGRIEVEFVKDNGGRFTQVSPTGVEFELIEPDAATTENWDFDPRRELKIGDRVRALSGLAKGFEGVIAQLPGGGTILVEFDNFDGHSGLGFLDSNRGW